MTINRDTGHRARPRRSTRRLHAESRVLTEGMGSDLLKDVVQYAVGAASEYGVGAAGEYNIEGDEGDLSPTPAVAEARLRRRIRSLVSEELGRPKKSTLNSAPIVTERWQKLAGIIKG